MGREAADTIPDVRSTTDVIATCCIGGRNWRSEGRRPGRCRWWSGRERLQLQLLVLVLLLLALLALLFATTLLRQVPACTPLFSVHGSSKV